MKETRKTMKGETTMKIHHTRALSLMLALLMVMCLFAGCGQEKAPEADAPEESAGTQAPAEAPDEPAGVSPEDTDAGDGFMEYQLPLTEEEVTFTYWDAKALTLWHMTCSMRTFSTTKNWKT